MSQAASPPAECPLRKKLAVLVKHLNAPVAAVGNIDIALCIRGDAVRRSKFAWLFAFVVAADLLDFTESFGPLVGGDVVVTSQTLR